MRSTVKCGIQRAGQLSSSLAVVPDGVPRLECQQARPLPVTQLQYLDRLDRDMGAGIDLGGRRIESPNALQRARFVAIQLLRAVRDGDECAVGLEFG